MQKISLLCTHRHRIQFIAWRTKIDIYIESFLLALAALVAHLLHGLLLAVHVLLKLGEGGNIVFLR